MQLHIDTDTISTDDIKLAIYMLEVLANRRGAPVTEREDFSTDTTRIKAEIVPSLVKVMGNLEQIVQANNELEAAISVVAPTPEPVSRLPDTPTLAVDADTDTAGVKWDATIHSESRAKNADGTWRKRRTAKNLVATTSNVAAPILPADPVVTDVPTPPAAVVPAPPAAVIPPPPATVSPQPASDPVVPATVPAPPASSVSTFQELMMKVGRLMAAQKITSKDVAVACATHGIASMQECFTNTALIPSMSAALDAAAKV